MKSTFPKRYFFYRPGLMTWRPHPRLSYTERLGEVTCLLSLLSPSFYFHRNVFKKHIHGMQIFWILPCLKLSFFYPNTWFIDWLWNCSVKITFPQNFESISLLYSNTLPPMTEQMPETSLILHAFEVSFFFFFFGKTS